MFTAFAKILIITKIEHSSFTGWTTWVSNPVCYPSLRSSTSVTSQKVAFAPGVPSYIFAFYCSTRNSTFLSCTLRISLIDPFRLSCPLRPVIPNNACPLCLTAAAGTELARASSERVVIIFLSERVLQPYGLHHPRLIAGSNFRSLPNIPHCCFTFMNLALVSVPMWLIVLLDQLRIFGLVCF